MRRGHINDNDNADLFAKHPQVRYCIPGVWMLSMFLFWCKTRVRQTDSFNWDTNPHPPRLYCKPQKHGFSSGRYFASGCASA